MIVAEMLLRDDVFNVKCQMRIVVLVHSAVFTAIAGTLAHPTTDKRFHRDCFASSSRAFAFKMAMKSANAI